MEFGLWNTFSVGLFPKRKIKRHFHCFHILQAIENVRVMNFSCGNKQQNEYKITKNSDHEQMNTVWIWCKFILVYNQLCISLAGTLNIPWKQVLVTILITQWGPLRPSLLHCLELNYVHQRKSSNTCGNMTLFLKYILCGQGIWLKILHYT